jgi:hypothetical protein
MKLVRRKEQDVKKNKNLQKTLAATNSIANKGYFLSESEFAGRQ